MSTSVGRPPFSNSLWVAIETMQFHIAQTKIFLRTPSFVSHPGGPNEQFDTHEKLSRGGGARLPKLDAGVYALAYHKHKPYIKHHWDLQRGQ